MQKAFGLTNNQLKILAMLTMLVDHIGAYLFPQALWLRCIGRLAFPLYAYMIGEGCRYTRDRRRYLAMVLGMGLVCQVAYTVATGSWFMNILLAFSLAIVTIYTGDRFRQKPTPATGLFFLLMLAAVVLVCVVLPHRVPGDFAMDYGLCGVLLPVVVYYAPGKWEKLLCVAVLLVVLSLLEGWYQWYGLLTLPLLMLYNGQRGRAKLKYVFYLFYPVHLAVIYGIGQIV